MPEAEWKNISPAKVIVESSIPEVGPCIRPRKSREGVVLLQGYGSAFGDEVVPEYSGIEAFKEDVDSCFKLSIPDEQKQHSGYS